MNAEMVLKNYYDCFNKKDYSGMLALLADNVAHDVNQGGRRQGKELFKGFLKHMDDCYEENVSNLIVLVSSENSHRAAAEFTISGKYKQNDSGLPPAKGQTYEIPVGAFFTLEDGKISRISNYYNLEDWIKQVSK